MSNPLGRLAEAVAGRTKVELGPEVLGRDLFDDLAGLVLRGAKLELSGCETPPDGDVLALEGICAKLHPDEEGEAGLAAARVRLWFFSHGDALACLARVTATDGTSEQASGA